MKYKELFWLDKYGWTGRWRCLGDMIACRYRFDPIPGSGSQWWYPNYYRQPKTAQEFRWSFAHKEYIRKKRYIHVVNPYEEGDYRSDHKDNNWKRCTKRKRQYKGV